MIDKFFQIPQVIARLRSSSLRGSIDDFAAFLLQRGYNPRLAGDYLRGAGHFGYWIDSEEIPLASLSESVAARFFREHVPRCKCPVPRGLPLCLSGEPA